ncbi:hypothetical protein PIB30_058738 [Stylosanthes scabra]|uniref:Uncharacterized protein n=1 Tax=Stylosanthes scabra TaxID=79078 RepID=A0ABU6VJN0_9FABA|nr:hypothetical protein [Stylosanthes scabra]
MSSSSHPNSSPSLLRRRIGVSVSRVLSKRFRQQAGNAGEGPSNRIQKRHRITPEDGESSTTQKEHREDDHHPKIAEHDENPVGSVTDDKDRSVGKKE